MYNKGKEQIKRLENLEGAPGARAQQALGGRLELQGLLPGRLLGDGVEVVDGAVVGRVLGPHAAARRRHGVFAARGAHGAAGSTKAGETMRQAR